MRVWPHIGTSEGRPAPVRKKALRAALAPRSIMSTCAKPSHKAAARMVGYALTLGDADGYADLADVLALRLTDQERAGLAYACLRAMDDQPAYDVASLALFGTLRGDGA